MQKILSETNNKGLCKVAMLFLALLPLLHWYDIGAPVGLGEAIMLIFTIIAFVRSKFNVRLFPKSFYILWAYIAFNWYYNNEINFGLTLLPGGATFFFFAVICLGSIAFFNLDELYKYMRCVVMLSIPIFIFQYIMLHTMGNHYCFVPNITGRFTYEGLLYSELVHLHHTTMSPCAFFIEKSYMAYYLVIFLCLELFYGKSRELLFSKFSLLIIFTLLILRSGSGLIGMIIPIIAKCISYYWNRSNLRYIMIVLAPLFLAFAVYLYIGTEIGATMLERQSELTEEGTSGFTRVMHGYMYFDNLDITEKIFGTSIKNLNELIYLSYAEKRFALNGIQFPLIQLGVVGLVLWIAFYINAILKTPIIAKLSVLTLFVLSSIEVTYLGPYMVMLTVIPCSYYLRPNQNISKT